MSWPSRLVQARERAHCLLGTEGRAGGGGEVARRFPAGLEAPSVIWRRRLTR